MLVNSLKFLSIFFTVLSLGGGLAHLYSLPNKIHLPVDQYFTAQQVYRGWQYLGIAILGQLVFTTALLLKVKAHRKKFLLAMSALVCILVTILIFFVFTYPTNVQTRNWTFVPQNWEQLRDQWEYSHAISCFVNLGALILLIFTALIPIESAERQRQTRKVS